MSFSTLPRRQLLLAGLSTAALVVLVASPGLLGNRVADALDGLGGTDARWLWLAVTLFAGMHALGGLAWCVALRACGACVDRADAVARYGVGSGLNAVAPAHLGSAVRVALFARVAGGTGGVWRVGGAGAAVGAVRATWLGGLILAAACAGVVPAWPLAVVLVVLGAAVAVAVVSRRLASSSRLGYALDAFRALSLRRRSLGAVALLTLAALAAKVAAATAIVAAVGIEHPFRAALIVVPAVELAAVMPLTPGNAGVASAAVAFALAAYGIASEPALATGIAFGAIETLAAAAVGAAGALALAGPLVRPVLRFAAVGTAGAAIVWTFALTVILPLA